MQAKFIIENGMGSNIQLGLSCTTYTFKTENEMFAFAKGLCLGAKAKTHKATVKVLVYRESKKDFVLTLHIK